VYQVDVRDEPGALSLEGGGVSCGSLLGDCHWKGRKEGEGVRSGESRKKAWTGN